MKFAAGVLVILLFGCGSQQTERPVVEDTAAIFDTTAWPEEDLIGCAGTYDGEYIDSIEYCNTRLFTSVDEGNSRIIEIHYLRFGEEKTYLLTDSFPGYLPMTYSVRAMQVNGADVEDDEIVVQFSGYRLHGGAGVTETKGESREEYFVFDPIGGRVLFNGVNDAEYIYYCGSASDPACEDIEVGYGYKVHFKSGEILLDSLRIQPDSKASDVDHRMGKYQWLDGMFINPD